MAGNYFQHYGEMYRAATPEVREASKRHWRKIYREAYERGESDDLAARLLATMAVMDSVIEEVGA